MTSVACGGAQHKRSYEEPNAGDLIKSLTHNIEEIESINTSSVMSYWQDGKRIKPTILVMAQKGSYIRVNAMGLTDDVEADLACNGLQFRYQDFRNNCRLEGLCDRLAVANLLRMNLSPDEFLLMAVGLSPVIEYTDLSLTWDAAQQRERLELIGAGSQLKQTIEFDGRSTHWDMLSSKIYNADDVLQWSIENKEFKDTTDEKGSPFRTPDKTRFVQPSTDLKIEIRWDDQKINPVLPNEHFEIELTEGIPSCHQAS